MNAIIILRDWTLEVPEGARFIGYTGENLARRLEIAADIGADWTCRLELRHSGGTEFSLPLNRDGNTLWAYLSREHLSLPGYVWVNVRAVRGRQVKKSGTAMLYIRETAGSGDCHGPPGGWDQLADALEGKGDALDYDRKTGRLRLLSKDRELSAVDLPAFFTDHRDLSHREAPDQHPMDAIAGLRDAMDRIPSPVEPITNFELEELLK